MGSHWEMGRGLSDCTRDYIRECRRVYLILQTFRTTIPFEACSNADDRTLMFQHDPYDHVGTHGMPKVHACSRGDSVCSSSDNHVRLIMKILQQAVFAVALVCCSSFLMPPPPLRTSTRLHLSGETSTSRHSTRQITMSESSSPESNPSSWLPSEPVNRRGLLKTLPEKFALGLLGFAAMTVPKQASATGLGGVPKAVPKGTRIVVLGGNGFVGSKVCETLVAAGKYSHCSPPKSGVDAALR